MKGSGVRVPASACGVFQDLPGTEDGNPGTRSGHACADRMDHGLWMCRRRGISCTAKVQPLHFH